MTGHLDPVIGRLTSLRSLRIGTIGSEDDAHGNLLYASWARLLDSVRQTLQVFYFDQGFSRNDETNRTGTCRGQRPGGLRLMDRLFVKHILPVLIKASWPCMRRMHIHGVGRITRRYESPTKPTKEELAEPGTLWNVEESRSGENVQYIIEKTTVAISAQAREHLKELLERGGDAETELVIEEEQGRDWEYLHYSETGVPQLDIAG